MPTVGGKNLHTLKKEKQQLKNMQKKQVKK